ncbi:hypothetical protein [Mycobacteroides chelonae]
MFGEAPVSSGVFAFLGAEILGVISLGIEAKVAVLGLREVPH